MRLFLMTAALFAGSAAAAQTPESPPPQRSPEARAEAQAKLMAADTNNDGKWSKEEWLAAGRRERGFEMMDANKDGFVTKEELQAGMARMQEMRANRPQ